MKITFCIFNREGKQYICVEENNTGKEHEIFLGSVDQTQFQENFIGILEIPKNMLEKEKMLQLIGKVLMSTKFS